MTRLLIAISVLLACCGAPDAAPLPPCGRKTYSPLAHAQCWLDTMHPRAGATAVRFFDCTPRWSGHAKCTLEIVCSDCERLRERCELRGRLFLGRDGYRVRVLGCLLRDR